MTCTINKTDTIDLQETLLHAIKDMSGLLSISTNDNNDKLLTPAFISSVANDISSLTEIIINNKDNTGQACPGPSNLKI
ncbi:MAG: hypothetical protein ABW201_08115 [Candidatus Thiodiazotropha sp.]